MANFHNTRTRQGVFLHRIPTFAGGLFLFFNSQYIWKRNPYSQKIMVYDKKTSQILAEKEFDYENRLINTDLSKYLVFANPKEIQILDSRTFRLIATIGSTVVYENAFFDTKYQHLVLFKDINVEVFDLKKTQPQSINKLKIQGTQNICISDDFPLLFYANYDRWGIIDFKENKKIFEAEAKYPENYFANGAFVPNQKAVFQFRNGQLGIFDISSQVWRPVGTILSKNQAIELNFPKLFLSEIVASPSQKLKKMQNLFGYEHHHMGSSRYFDNQTHKIYQVTPPNKVWDDIKNTQLIIFDAKKKIIEYQTDLKMLDGDEYKIKNVSDNKILVSKGLDYNQQHYNLIDYKHKKVVSLFKTPKECLGCYTPRLSKNNKYALFRKVDFPKSVIKIVDTKTDKTVLEVLGSEGIISPDEKYLICITDDIFGILEIYDIEKKKSIKKFFYDKTIGFVNSMYIDEAENQIFVATHTGNIAIFNLQTLQFFGKIKVMENWVNDMMYTDEKFLYIQGRVETKIFDKKTRKLHLGLIIKLSDNYQELQTMVYTDENFYMLDKNLSDFIAFKKNDKTYTFDQFDLQYNRPDIVLERMGFASKELIESYRKAYEKRLRKLNFDPKNFEKDKSFNAPELQLKNQENFVQEVKTAIFTLNFEAKDALFNLDRLNLYVNGVPVFGTKGQDLKEKNTKNYAETLKIELSKGKNLIELSVLNEKGVESLKEKLEVNFVGENAQNAQKPVLHLVTIGVSEYENTQMNLKYATKDGKDLAALLQMQVQKQKDIFQSVKYHALFDKDATKENIINLKKELQKTNINDVVMVFVSGHGLLDSELDYFLATNNVDFDNPKAKGLPYDELENLLDGIPARQKILMLDACHSGEIDKEEIALVAKNEAISNDKTIKFKNFDKKTVTNKNVGLQNSFELSKQMFTDLRKGSGTTVLSAAGGVQLAQESSEWQNGAFTYCVLSGLKNMKADLNKDGKIMLSELQNYLFTEVPKITGGLQQPTSRIENLINDFRIW